MSAPQAALIERLKQGDRNALAEFAESHRPQLLAFIANRMSDSLRRVVEPSDILQEIVINALNSLPDIDLGDRDPFNWLCQLAERRVIDAHRRHFGSQKRAAWKEVGVQARPNESSKGGLVDLLVASITSPSEAFSRNQREFHLLAALKNLPQQSRDALRMRYVDGLSTKDIAQELGKSDGAVRVLLSRSLKKLHNILIQNSEFQSLEAARND